MKLRRGELAAAVFAMLGLVFTLLTAGGWNDLSVYHFTFRLLVLFGSLLLLSYALRRYANQKKSPRSLAVVSKVYFVALGVLVVASTVLGIALELSVTIKDSWWFFAFAVVSFGVYGLVVYVIGILPIWAFATYIYSWFKKRRNNASAV